MTDFNVSFLLDEDCGLLSGSVAELGANAGRITWSNCMALAETHPIVSEEQAEEIRDYFRGYGAWEDEEINAWTLQELSALVIQEAAAEMRQLEDHAGGDWQEYEKGCQEGKFSGNIYQSGEELTISVSR